MIKRMRIECKALLYMMTAALIGVGSALAAPCWNSANMSIIVNVPSPGCSPGCPFGQVCVQFTYSCSLWCNAQNGDTGCTYCFWVAQWHWDPVTSQRIEDATSYPSGGAIGCGTVIFPSFSEYICRTPGQSIGSVIAIYDVPCSQITPATGWKKYRDVELTVPDAP
jgi:hypothetical protein